MDPESRESSLNYFRGKIAGWLFDPGMNVERGTGFEMSDGADKLYELKGQALEDALKPDNLFAEKSPFRTAAEPDNAPEAAVNKEKVGEKKQPEAGLNV